jgi:hypothetical protein
MGDLSALANRVDATWIVVFNTDWLGPRVQDRELLVFLRTVVPMQVGLVAIGDETSALFDALKAAGVHEYEGGRNPAYDNPPVAGYTLRSAERPDGTVYHFPVILLANSYDPFEIAQYLLEWR